jgi:D-alanine transaminase
MRWPDCMPSGRIAYVDGRYVRHGQAGVHIEDRGLQLGDAVYEVCRIAGGRILDEEEHLDRLERSLGEIEMAMPMGRGALKSVMAEVARRNGMRDGLLYLQITRGALRRDHPIPTPAPKPTLILTDAGADATSKRPSFWRTCSPRRRRAGRGASRLGWSTRTAS